jgi:flagellar biogenesis protein FliO
MLFALEGTNAMSGTDIMAQILPAFLLVIGAPLAIWWWMKRSRRGPTKRLRITDKAALGRNTWIAVAEIDGQRFLLGAGEHGVGMLSELEPAPAIETEEASVTVGIEPNATERTTEPRMGLIRRLQLMTLRTSARPPGSFDAPLG